MQGSQLFSDPVIGLNIVSYLPPIDYIMLRRAIPAISRRSNAYPSAYEFAMRAYTAYVKRYARNEQILVTILKDYVLSGGFLLAVLNGEPVDQTQDMDFYNPEGIIDTRLPERFQRNNGGYQEDDEPEMDEYYGPLTEIRCIDRYKGNERPLQIITAPATVFNQFDLDICRNGLGRGELRITNPLGILQRTAVVDVWKRFPAVYSRQKIKGIATLQKNRMRKYMARGYDLSFRVWNDLFEPDWEYPPTFVQPWELREFEMDDYRCCGEIWSNLSIMCGCCEDCEASAAVMGKRLIDFWRAEWLRDASLCGEDTYRLNYTAL